MNAPGFWEVLFLGVLALMIFGPEQLPKLARSAGQFLGQIKREASGTLDELKAAADLEDFREVARDLQETSADLKRSASLSPSAGAGAVAASTRREKPHSADLPAPAPFDPDAP